MKELLQHFKGYNGTGQGYDSNNRHNGTLKFKKSMFNN